MLFLAHLSLIQILGTIFALLVAITFHEFTHALVADYYGDPTAKHMGRVSLNPFAHLDLLGTIFLVIVGFGWGKPVIVNPNNFKNPKLDNLTVSLAGPISNLILALFFGLILRFFNGSMIISTFLVGLVVFNLILMIFNFLPIPPLDGSKILAIFTSDETYLFLQRIGVPLLLILIIFSNFIPIIPLIETKVIFNFFNIITAKPELLLLLF